MVLAFLGQHKFKDSMLIMPADQPYKTEVYIDWCRPSYQQYHPLV